MQIAHRVAKRIPGFVRGAVTLAAIFFTLLLASDLFLWLFLPVSIDGHVVEKPVTQNLPGLKKRITYTRNEYGLRSLSMDSLIKPANTVRILCLGASTTEQVTQNTEDTWCGILETELNRQYSGSGFRVETIAYGKGGHRAIHNWLWIQDNLDRFAPDMVITLLGINDVLSDSDRDGRRKIIEKWQDKKKINEFKIACTRYSQICRRLKILSQKNKLRKQLRTGRVVEWHSKSLPELRKTYRGLPYIEKPARGTAPITDFGDSVRSIVTYLERKKVPVILLGQPVLWKNEVSEEEYNTLWFSLTTSGGRIRPSTQWLYAEMKEFNLVQQSLGNDSTVKYLDLDKLIPKTLEYYFDDCHYTDRGSRAVAEEALPVVISTLEMLPFVRQYGGFQPM